MLCTRVRPWWTRSSGPRPTVPLVVGRWSRPRSGDDAHRVTPRGQPGVDRLAALQLPAHPVNDSGGTEPARMQPGALADLARLGATSTAMAVHTSLASVSASMNRSADALIANVTWSARSRAGSKSIATSNSWGGDTGHHAPAVQAAGQLKRMGARRAEPAVHVQRVKGREVAERVHAEPVQQSCQLVVDEDADRQRGEEPGRRAGRHDAHGVPWRSVPGGLLRRERPVGDADPGSVDAEFVQAADAARSRPAPRHRSTGSAPWPGWHRCRGGSTAPRAWSPRSG